MFDFLQPLSNDLLIEFSPLSNQSLGKKVQFHTKENQPTLEANSIAIIGVLDNRGSDYLVEHSNFNEIRKQLYNLFPGNWSKNIYDLGDILKGNTIEDTYFAVKTVCATLIKMQVVPLIIGGSQNITYAMYRSYDTLDQMVNVVTVDSKFDFENNHKKADAQSYLTRMIVDEPTNLFNFSNIGYQSYFNSQEEIDLIEKLYFEAYRLGEVTQNITIAEPVFRDADLVSIDLTSVTSSVSCNLNPFNPNGFSGKEICTLARYSGISDKVSSFGVFNHNNSRQEAALIVQIIWYFIEGFHYRLQETPSSKNQNFIKYIVPMEDETNLVFYKSTLSDRWWIEVSNFNFSKKLVNSLLPCSHQDYLLATTQEIPNRWWKAQRKNCI
ncbi:MAG TPA: arginase [Flavobacterium sp.]|nr:arginase [Flavobacterium sp.]